MQFKHPELLWALMLLIIPLIVHLFQLRRYQRTAFTNVRLLKKVVSHSRRSQVLKKWLLLLTRLLLITAIVLAFAEPYFAPESWAVNQRLVIYLDNSFSMQAHRDNTPLLDKARQELLRQLPSDKNFTLFTNGETFSNIRVRDIQNELLQLPYSADQLNLKEVGLKADAILSNMAGGDRYLLAISDFQDPNSDSDSLSIRDMSWVQLRPESVRNISIDTAFISESTPTTLEFKIGLTAYGTSDDTPVSLYNGDTLIAKSAATFDEEQAEVVFTLPQDKAVDGRVEISDGSLVYDNYLYFTLDKKEKIKVLAVSEAADGFLKRLYRDDIFELSSYQLNQLNYSLLDSQQLIILNELESIPAGLQTALTRFRNEGGTLVVIPATDGNLESYNQLLSQLGAWSMGEAEQRQQLITDINYSHPLLTEVFAEQVRNFQYPAVQSFYQLNSNSPNVLSLEGGTPFLAGTNGMYVFSSPLNPDISNFQNSPLIVPVFYNFALKSLQRPELYVQIGRQAEVDLPLALSQDQIIRLTRPSQEIIPLQQSFPTKTRLTFMGLPEQAGSYKVRAGDELLGQLSFNYTRDESTPVYSETSDWPSSGGFSSIRQFFEKFEKDSRVTELWKWFVILALLFIMAEVLIQKLLK